MGAVFKIKHFLQQGQPRMVQLQLHISAPSIVCRYWGAGRDMQQQEVKRAVHVYTVVQQQTAVLRNTTTYLQLSADRASYI